MKLTATTIGSLGQIMAEEVRAGEKAATAAVRQAGEGHKAGWRAQIIGAGLGMRLAKTDNFWLAIPTPAAGRSLRGGRITPREWERRTGLGLRFVYRRNGPSLLVAEGRLNTKGRAVRSRSRSGRGVATVPIFLLVPQVRLPKRLDLVRDAVRAHDALPGLIVRAWVP